MNIFQISDIKFSAARAEGNRGGERGRGGGAVLGRSWVGTFWVGVVRGSSGPGGGGGGGPGRGGSGREAVGAVLRRSRWGLAGWRPKFRVPPRLHKTFREIQCVFCTVLGKQNTQTTNTSPRKTKKKDRKTCETGVAEKKKHEILDGPGEGGPGGGGSKGGVPGPKKKRA